MKHLMTLLALVVAVTAGAQESGFPYNPDANTDGFVGTEDLLIFLSDFGYDADVISCSRGEVCLLEYYSSSGYPNPLIFDVDETCTFISVPKRNTTQLIRLPVDSVADGRVIDLVITHHPLGASQYQSVFVQALINDEWDTIGGSGPNNGDGWCCCDPEPCVTHSDTHNPRLFRYMFNGSTWEPQAIDAMNISPTFD